MIKKASVFFAVAATILSVFGCKSGLGGSSNAADLTAGTMTFSISLPKDANMGGLSSMIPKEGIMYFDTDKAAIEVSAMGLITMRMITDGNAHTQTMLVSGIGGKEAATATEKDLAPALDSLNIIAEETAETKEILGMKATKFILRDTIKHLESAIYIAKDAPLGNIYWCLPFHNLKGLILEYEIEYQGEKLRLTATKIDAKTPDAKEFAIPDGYKKTDWKNRSGGL